MRPIPLLPTLLAAAVLVAMAGCDTPKPAPSQQPSATPPAPAASAAAPAQAAQAASEPPNPSVPAVARKRKDPASCSKQGPLSFDDPAAETAIRRQLQK